MKILGAFALSAVFVAMAISCFGQDEEYTRLTLKGLKGVRVVVEDLSTGAEAGGLTRSLVQTDVELRLRDAGIRVVSPRELGEPYLYVVIHAERVFQQSLYATLIRVSFRQNAVLERDRAITAYGAETWSAGSVEIFSSEKMSRGTRDELGDLVDRFCKAYLSENTK